MKPDVCLGRADDVGKQKPQPACRRHSADMRVLVLFGGVPLWGSEKANTKVFEVMRAAGIHSRFVTNRDWGHESIQPELTRLKLEWTVSPFGPRIGRGLGVRGWLRVAAGVVGTNRVFMREMRNYRPTHLYAMNPEYVLYASPAILLCRMPLIYRIGDSPQVHNAVRRCWWRLLTWRISVLVANCEFIYERCRRAGTPAGKIRVIYSTATGADSVNEVAYSGTRRLRVTHYRNNGMAHEWIEIEREDRCLTVVFCGQLSEAKGVGVLVAAALKLIQEGLPLRVLIAGDYSWKNEYAHELIRQVQQSGAAGIRFLGYVNNTADLWSLADLHVCPSCWDEPLSNTVLEAKQAGVASVVFPTGGLPETVEHGVNGWLCDAADEAALERALRHYLENPEEARQQGSAAKKNAETKFGLERFRQQWADVFAGTVQGGWRRKANGNLEVK